MSQTTNRPRKLPSVAVALACLLALSLLVAASASAQVSLSIGQKFAYKFISKTSGAPVNSNRESTITWEVASTGNAPVFHRKLVSQHMNVTEDWGVSSDGTYRPVTHTAVDMPIPPLLYPRNFFGPLPPDVAKGSTWTYKSATKYLGDGEGRIVVVDQTDRGMTFVVAMDFRGRVFPQLQGGSSIGNSITGATHYRIEASFLHGVLQRWSRRGGIEFVTPQGQSGGIDTDESAERVLP